MVGDLCWRSMGPSGTVVTRSIQSAQSISFALILSENVGANNPKSILKMPQVEIEVDVQSGMDPYTIQELRDAVSDSFKDRRAALNKLIANAEKALENEKSPKKRKELAAVKLKEINAVITKFEQNLTKRVNDFIDEQEKKQQAFKKAQVKFVVNTGWQFVSVFEGYGDGDCLGRGLWRDPHGVSGGGQGHCRSALDLRGWSMTCAMPARQAQMCRTTSSRTSRRSRPSSRPRR